MASGLYRPGMTPGVLAEKWGISRQTVANLACEASRNIRREIGHCEDIRARMIATLSTITAESIGSKKYRDAIEAVRVMSGVVDSDERSTLEQLERAEAKKAAASDKPSRLIVELRSSSKDFEDEVGPIEPKPE